MSFRYSPLLFLSLFLGLGLALVAGPASRPAPAPASAEAAGSVPAQAKGTVYLLGGLSNDNVVVASAAVAAADPNGMVLLDTPKTRPVLKHFLSAYRPDRVVPVGSFAEGVRSLERRLGVKTAPVATGSRGPPLELWKVLFSKAERVVVCPDSPRRLVLQAACLAGSLQAPLFVTRGSSHEAGELRRLLAEWHTREVFVAGASEKFIGDLADVHVVPLADPEAVAAAHVRQLLKKGPIRTLVVANPADTENERGGMSVLAPWVALQHQAALLLTNEAGDNTAALVRQPDLLQADDVILVGTTKAIPMERRPNPAPGKDTDIEMEPLTPTGQNPFSYATGRLFHEDPGVVALMLARQRLLQGERAGRPRRALIVSNPDGDLPFLEVFSHNTARELVNRGYDTTFLFGEDVSKEQVPRLVPQQDIFLWEGHYKTLTDDFGLPNWKEPLRPSFVFLQSCLALNQELTDPLLQRGAVGVVGSSSRIYSATGGTFTLAFFDGLLYDGRPLGSSLRQAKNFLLTYTLLKEKRLKSGAHLSGANLRSAWAFTLWGDPTWTLPRPRPPAGAMPAVHTEAHGHTITLTLPEQRYEPVTVDKYRSQMLPNARLAGLLVKDHGKDTEHLVPFLFTEVYLPDAPADRPLRLRSRLPESHWVFNWDPRRRTGYLLITPRPRDETEIRFFVDWDE